MELKLDVKTGDNRRNICAGVFEIEPRHLDSRCLNEIFQFITAVLAVGIKT
jgi:hypothetical protein